ncbi:hypothetical protein QQM79_08195 [Marinobacteraceae bacterium S3BR75-40.1]
MSRRYFTFHCFGLLALLAMLVFSTWALADSGESVPAPGMATMQPDHGTNHSPGFRGPDCCEPSSVASCQMGDCPATGVAADTRVQPFHARTGLTLVAPARAPLASYTRPPFRPPISA